MFSKQAVWELKCFCLHFFYIHSVLLLFFDGDLLCYIVADGWISRLGLLLRTHYDPDAASRVVSTSISLQAE